MKKVLLAMISVLCIASVFAGQQGEVVLDTAQNYQTSNVLDTTIEAGLSLIPGGVIASGIYSSLVNDLPQQDINKQNAANQNTELTAAKLNLDNSKENVKNMFLYIVSTLLILLDLVVSIIYISLILAVVWIVFVGYAKIMIMIIDFVHGRYKKYYGGNL